MAQPPASTATREYAERLARVPCWKRTLGVQAPYRWNLRRLELGYVLDLGCGTGRNLAHLDGRGVGVDHNPHAVEAARGRGLEAYTPQEFRASPHAVAGRFESLLCAHVLEHLRRAEARELLGGYLPFVRPLGRVVLITPQEAGFRRDPTHVEFLDSAGLEELLATHGLVLERRYSFPFPRWAGHLFPHNEFVVVGRVPSAPAAPQEAEVAPGRPRAQPE